MKVIGMCIEMGILATLAMVSTPSWAQAGGQPRVGAGPTIPNSGPSGSGQTAPTGQPLPPPQSSNDPAPPVAMPAVAASGVTEQAGVGGTQAYGRAGVLELGGSIGFAKSGVLTDLNVSPSIGYFLVDNLQISALVGFRFADVDGKSNIYLTALAEPSYHLPISDKLFGFVGVGAGLGYTKGPGAGFALAPRLGMNVLIGRSGILTPALQFVYSTTEAIQTSQGTLLAGNTSFGANIGYTVMW